MGIHHYRENSIGMHNETIVVFCDCSGIHGSWIRRRYKPRRHGWHWRRIVRNYLARHSRSCPKWSKVFVEHLRDAANIAWELPLAWLDLNLALKFTGRKGESPLFVLFIHSFRVRPFSNNIERRLGGVTGTCLIWYRANNLAWRNW